VAEVGAADQARGVDKRVTDLDDHVGCWCDVHQGCLGWVALRQPYQDGYVVLGALQSAHSSGLQ